MRDGEEYQARDVFRAARVAGVTLLRSQAPQMAAALAFRSLFGIVPVLVVATLVAKSVMGDEFPKAVATLVSQLGLDSIRVIPPSGSDSGTEPVALGTWAEELIRYAAGLNLRALGWVGLGVVVFSAIWVMIAIEESFNAICEAPTRRSWVKRVLVYWFVLSVGPVAFAAAPLAMRATAGIAVSAAATWALLTIAYMTVPTTPIRFRPALGGALLAALLVEAGRRSLGAYMEHAFSVSALYGSLGLVPLFMFWVYVMWMVVLYGLQVSVILQSIRGGAWALARGAALEQGFEPGTAVVAARAVAARFARGLPTRAGDLAEASGLPPRVAHRILERLEARGVLARNAADPPAWLLARPAGEIPASEALEAGFALVDGDGHLPRDDPRHALRAAQLRALDGARIG